MVNGAKIEGVQACTGSLGVSLQTRDYFCLPFHLIGELAMHLLKPEEGKEVA